MTRVEQRAQTRQRIVDAAVESFAAHGFGEASTRDIAARAGVTQGLVTYHFESKDELWRAAADWIFGQLGGELAEPPRHATVGPAGEGAREAIRSYVRFSARHPELFHFMVDAGRRADGRMRWLVRTHLAPRFAAVAGLAGTTFPADEGDLAPHVYYALLGAASLIFSVGPECKALTGVDPAADDQIERHADLVARLFVPG